MAEATFASTSGYSRGLVRTLASCSLAKEEGELSGEKASPSEPHVLTESLLCASQAVSSSVTTGSGRVVKKVMRKVLEGKIRCPEGLALWVPVSMSPSRSLNFGGKPVASAQGL